MRKKERGVSRFLNVHTLDNGSVDALLLDRTARAITRARCLKHWLSDDGRKLALLIEAPDEETARAFDPDASETSELLAPAERWLAYDTIDI